MSYHIPYNYNYTTEWISSEFNQKCNKKMSLLFLIYNFRLCSVSSVLYKTKQKKKTVLGVGCTIKCAFPGGTNLFHFHSVKTHFCSCLSDINTLVNLTLVRKH